VIWLYRPLLFPGITPLEKMEKFGNSKILENLENPGNRWTTSGLRLICVYRAGPFPGIGLMEKLEKFGNSNF